eukprot:scaffold4136_cov101-Isochrysis_galbana.AAC.2
MGLGYGICLPVSMVMIMIADQAPLSAIECEHPRAACLPPVRCEKVRHANRSKDTMRASWRRCMCTQQHATVFFVGLIWLSAFNLGIAFVISTRVTSPGAPASHTACRASINK